MVRPAFLLLSVATFLPAQDLTPRAYIITPKGTTVLTVQTAFSSGDISFDPSLPVKDSSATIQVPVLSVYHSFSLYGRSANIVVAVPYAHGEFQGTVLGERLSLTRSGLADIRVRGSVNLYGGKAMTLPEYAKYSERTTLGTSFTVIMPTGQYDPARLINVGSNRWAIKPELGFTRRNGRWAIDLYGGLWVFFDNNRFYPGTVVRTQAVVPNGEAHIGYYVTPRLWISFDANFWSGGQTARNGLLNDDEQRNSRIGATVSLPFKQHQSFKFAYSRGAYVTIGAAYNTVSVGWQYTWLKR